MLKVVAKRDTFHHPSLLPTGDGKTLVGQLGEPVITEVEASDVHMMCAKYG